MMPRSSSGEFQAVLQTLRGGEDAAERRPDIFAEDIGDAEMFFAVVEGQANGLNEGGHEIAALRLPQRGRPVKS